jgi:hypothetical protein
MSFIKSIPRSLRISLIVIKNLHYLKIIIIIFLNPKKRFPKFQAW